MLQPNLGAFVRYLSTPDARRKAQAQKLSMEAASDYAVETDFWKRMRAAIVTDRKTTRDGFALREAVEKATPKKQPSFGIVANAWPSIAKRWAGSSFRKPASGVINVGGLDISVRPLFSEEWPDGHIENVAVWMNKPAPSESAVRGAMRLMTRLEPDARVVATFVDVRRAAVWSAGADELALEDAWLERAGARFAADAA